MLMLLKGVLLVLGIVGLFVLTFIIMAIIELVYAFCERHQFISDGTLRKIARFLRADWLLK